MARFRTSARSVDMLGRQQIAGVPTAVSEIFKNAYDAYATRARGDFFPERRVLVIRDDGVGMSREDFESRWLTVGTDSKAKGSALPKIPRPPNTAERRQMGEKGIGRLAIATLAPQLLVVTRPQRSLDRLDDHLVVALIQWSLFEAPGLTLEDVTVPIREVAHLDEITPGVVIEMRDEFLAALDKLGDKVSAEHRARIVTELGYLDADVLRYLRLNGPRIGTGSGTAFVLSAVHEDLDAAMTVNDAKANDYSVSEFQRFLLGFTNTITSENKPDFDTEFVRHEPAGPVDVIDPASYFWEAEDFKDTDHTIEGEFDEFGTFRGKVSIYGNEPVEVVESWTGAKGDRSSCGPFRIKFGYVQGQASDSRLPAEDFARMTERLEKIGGLYVYRDGIRVLPYGNSDYDYLQIEQRRSLNAGTYFFSYRRMFGAIEIDSERNPQLQEKAGREGFRENRAYRDFRDILKGFLVQLAANFFSNRAETAEEWRTERDRLKRRAEARAARERTERIARERFAKQLHDKINFIESGRLGSAAEEIVRRAEARLADESQLIPDILGTERSASDDIEALRDRIAVVKPADLPLSRDEERDFHSYKRLLVFADEQLTLAANRIEAILQSAKSDEVGRENVERERKERRARLSAVSDAGRQRIRQLAADVQEQVTEVGGRLAADAHASLAAFDEVVSQLRDEAETAGFSEELRLASEIRSATESHAAVLGQLLEQAHALIENDGMREENLLLKEEVLDLHEQLDGNVELLQLGQAVQIVSHEFEASIRSVRNGLKALQPWAKSTPRLQPIVRDLRASFAHLDGYLRLFTPLQRRLYREAVTINGDEIESFLRGVFSDRLDRHDVEMVATEAFREWAFTGYPSTFYPAFVNLVDNAIHWIDAEPTEQRRITLDADSRGASISDTGPGVRPRDQEAIFERGFSRRRGGRGLGLSLARELLERDGWTLDLVPDETGAVFRLTHEEGAEG